MKYRISHPTKKITGGITLTASKSESNRALIIRAVCREEFAIENLASAEDTETLKRILDDSAVHSADSTFDVGAAGTTMRFLTAYLSNS